MIKSGDYPPRCPSVTFKPKYRVTLLPDGTLDVDTGHQPLDRGTVVLWAGEASCVLDAFREAMKNPAFPHDASDVYDFMAVMSEATADAVKH